MKERNTVLVVGRGGRESALVDKYAQSPHVKKVIAVPGNDLMKINTGNVEIHPELPTPTISQVIDICEEEHVALVDVARDRDVEAGLVNALEKRGIPAVGPTRDAGKIEWDKAYARRLGFQLELPQPDFTIRTVEELDSTFNLLDLLPNQPWFIKAAFLADGKGAKPVKNNTEAKERVLEISGTEEGKVFLLEEWLKGDDGSPGEEFSLFVITDGEHYRVLGSATDYKRENNFDEGENTGSMGCNSPALLMTDEFLKKTKKTIIEKIIPGLHEIGRPYKGVLYLGGMALRKAKHPYANYPDEFTLEPYVVEFNARWGDPEAQAILPGIETDLFELGIAVADGDITKTKIKHDNKTRVAVTGASKGYPGDYSYVRGKQIHGLEEAMKIDGVKVYGAGVKKLFGKYCAWGGRLFYIVGEGKDIVEARKKAYEAMSIVSIEGNNLHFRTDIGWRDVERLRK